MIGTAGVAAAAQSALPGDVLYWVKDFTEGVRLKFASGDLERGRLHLAYARERLDEVEAGRGRLSPDQLSATLDRLDHEAAAGADELLQAAVDDGPRVLDELDDFTAELRLRLQDLTASLPLSVRPAAERTLEVLRRIDLQVTGLLGLDGAGCAVCADGTSVQPRVVLPGDGSAAPSCRCVQPAPGVDGTDPKPRPSSPRTTPWTAPSPTPRSSPTMTRRCPARRPATAWSVTSDRRSTTPSGTSAPWWTTPSTTSAPSSTT